GSSEALPGEDRRGRSHCRLRQAAWPFYGARASGIPDLLVTRTLAVHDSVGHSRERRMPKRRAIRAALAAAMVLAMTAPSPRAREPEPIAREAYDAFRVHCLANLANLGLVRDGARM